MNPFARKNGGAKGCGAIARTAALAAFAALVAGCSTNLLSSKSTGTTSTASGSVPFGDRISSLFGHSGSAPPATPAAAQPVTSEDFDCPRIDIRSGASTLLAHVNPAEPDALGLRYQGTFVRAARECRVLGGGSVNIRVGVEGRIILGPAGTTGSVTVPLRYALVHEKLGSGKPIWTRLYPLQVELPQQTQSVVFTHIEEDMTVPIPPAYDLQDYVIYIGFDPAGLETAKPKPPEKPAPKGRKPRTG